MDGKKLFVSVLTLAGVVIFSFTFYRAVYYAPADEIPISESITVKDIPAESQESARPARLLIPKINVDAKVEEVGITRKGNMAVPRSYSEVGWYKYGTVPGQLGSAVLAGHLDNGLALPGVFSNLNDLSEGDSIYVLANNNEKLHFVVTGKEVFDFNAKVDKIFEENDARRLRLITCTGTWIAQYKTHNQRLVVTAQLVE